MERPPSGAAGGDAAETAVGGSPLSPASTSTASPPPVAAPLIDTQLLQLSLLNAVASAAAGRATVAANNYALVIKIIFRKCFLLEELVLLALAMGYETREALHTASPHVAGDDDRKGSSPDDSAAGAGPHDCPPSTGVAHEQLVDPLASVGKLLPPGLDEDDYDEERMYSEQKELRDQPYRHPHALTPPVARDGADIASPVSSTSPTPHDSTPGYDAATARWLACLLAKVHPDALPIATLEKICKLPLTGSPNAAASSPARGGAAARRQVTSTTSAASIGNWPSATGVNDSPSTSTVTALPLLPSLKSSPTSSPPGAASPMAAGGRRDMPTGSPNNNDGAAASAAAAAVPFSSASLSLLFATLLWDVACALWNEGFIEDAHHWLSVMDVRRLWKLYKDMCRGGSHEQPSSILVVREPPEESVKSGNRACALSWPAVLAESCAADASLSARRPLLSSAATESPSGSTGQTISSSGAQQEHAVSSPVAPQPRQGILLSALSQAGGPLPMTDLAACFTDPAELEVGNVDKDAVTVAAQSRTDERNVGGDAAAMHAEARTAALANFVRRLARRTSALRDLCGLMIACETAEDVFYVLYALSSALATQQWKYDQQQERQRADEAAAAARSAADTAAETTTTTTNGGLSELLIIANLLIELFITKRAQQLLLEEGGLDEFASGIATAPSPLEADGRGGGAEDASRRPSRQQQRRTDRAIRRACDEVVGAFTNGRCLTLYALESYGIPPPCNGDSNTAEAQLLAPELPYVLVSNVLSSTLNYSTRYLFSKVYHGVMGCRSRAPAEHHQEAGIGTPSPSSSAAAASVPSHPNRTRRATDAEKERRRAWTMPPAAAAVSPQRTPPSHAHAPPAPGSTTITASVQSAADELFGLVKKTAVNWRDLGNMVHPSVPPQPRSSDNCNYGCKHHHQDVRPSFSMADAPGGDPLLRREGGGGYAERLAAARREHHAAAGDTSSSKERVQLGEAMPWSAGSPATVTSNSSSLADASSTSGAYRGGADSDAPSTSPPGRGGRSRGCALKTRGVGAAEIMLPSSSSVAVSLLAEENEFTALADAVGELAPAPAAPATVVHTAAAHLQSRSPSEAVSLRLLALLYRYPQLHTLEPVTASHVDLVAKELNKALHILQTAMRGRFGDGWWLQWRSRREGETQRYYARALTDAHRGGYPLSFPATPLPSSSSRAAGAPGAAVVPPGTIGVSAVQPDPSLLFAGARPWHAPVKHEQGTANAWGLDPGWYHGIPPPSAPPPSSRAHTVLSDLWCTHTLMMPKDEGLRKPLQGLRGHFTGATTSPAPSRATAAAATDTASVSAAAMHGDAQGTGVLLDVDWDIPPAYTPDVSLDFSAFTMTSVETQESTRQLVESLQQRERTRGDDGDGGDSGDDSADAPGVSVLSRACRRLLHSELPLLQQYSPWRVIYSTRLHGISLSTLFANCRREAERQALSGYAANSAPSNTPSDSKPMLLILELPSSTTLQFSEDDAGVQEAWTHSDTPSSTRHPDAHRRTDGGGGGGVHHRHNKLFVGAFLSDLLRLESRRYYGSQACFVFQLLVPGTVGGEATASGAPAASAGPQLRVYRATRSNAQYINCRTTSIVIGGGAGGSSIYLDSTLCHGATSVCATFASPPLSTWVSTPREAAGDGADGESAMHRQQKSLCVLNVEVIVMDT